MERERDELNKRRRYAGEATVCSASCGAERSWAGACTTTSRQKSKQQLIQLAAMGPGPSGPRAEPQSTDARHCECTRSTKRFRYHDIRSVTSPRVIPTRVTYFCAKIRSNTSLKQTIINKSRKGSISF